MKSLPVPSTTASDPMKGYIHSQESFGTVDGPGIRYVLFMQGCPMRCLYCHNPDTWGIGQGTAITVEEVLQNYDNNRAFYKKGGITLSGGEPLLQIDFVMALCKAAKERGIHTCIDTSGITYQPDNKAYMAKLDDLMPYVDLVMLDIKHIDADHHKTLTGYSNEAVLGFASYLAEKQVDLWVRHVVVPGYTDNPDDLRELGRFIGKLPNLKAVDVIPYHTMGVVKYKALEIPYPLEGVEPATKEETAAAKAILMEGLRETRIKQ